MTLPPTQLGILVTVAAAMLIGGIIGAERELSDKPAGLRTHMLVCGAAALLISLDRMIVSAFSQEFGSSGGVFRADPITSSSTRPGGLASASRDLTTLRKAA